MSRLSWLNVDDWCFGSRMKGKLDSIWVVKKGEKMWIENDGDEENKSLWDELIYIVV